MSHYVNKQARRWQELIPGRAAPTLATFAEPADLVGWVILTRLLSADDSWPSDNALMQLYDAGLGTMAMHLDADDSATVVGSLDVGTAHLRATDDRALPIAYLGNGKAGTAGWMAAIGGDLAGVMVWNARPELAWWHLPLVEARSLLMTSTDASRWRGIVAEAARLRLGSRADLIRDVPPFDLTTAATWYHDRLLSPKAPARTVIPLARKAASVAAVATLASMVAARPAAAAAKAVPNFATGRHLGGARIRGDRARLRHSAAASSLTASSLSASSSQTTSTQGKKLRRHRIGGDGTVTPFVTGSQDLVDASGVQHFVNTNITFSTSSSASGAMSEASYNHAVPASTLNGGTTASTLNDAYDGYQGLCVDLGHTNGQCEAGNSNFVMFEKNGPATTECSGRQIDFPTQVIGNLRLTRKVFVPSNDAFGRWLNIVTNTGATAQTVELTTSNNLGSDTNTVIVNDSSGNTTPTTSDTWVTTFQNFSGTTTSDPRLGHVLQGPGAPVGLSHMFFANGNDRPDWGYTFSVPAGQTAIIMNFGVTMPSKAAAAAKSAALAGLTDAHALDCMTQGEISEVQNFVAKATPTVTVTAVPSPAPFASPVTFTATVAPPGGSTHTPTGTVSFFLDGQSPAVAVVPVGPSGMASFTTSGLGPGLHTVSANYSGDTNFSPASSTTSASDTITCTTTITGSHSGSLSVTSGSTCLSPGASVTGSVIVSAGASLVVDHGTVTGSISASNPNAIRLCGSTTGGSVTVIGAKGLVMIGGEALDECAPNRIGGSMIVLNNSGGLEVIGNHTGSPITAANNSGPGAVPADTSPLIAGNTTGSAPPG